MIKLSDQKTFSEWRLLTCRGAGTGRWWGLWKQSGVIFKIADTWASSDAGRNVRFNWSEQALDRLSGSRIGKERVNCEQGWSGSGFEKAGLGTRSHSGMDKHLRTMLLLKEQSYHLSMRFRTPRDSELPISRWWSWERCKSQWRSTAGHK